MRTYSKQLNRLSPREIQAKREAGYFHDGGGLYLQVSSSGAKSWILRYTFDGKTKDLGLGSLSVVNATKARQKALECRQQVSDGIDPLQARLIAKNQRLVEKAQDFTFDQCADAYIKGHAARWKNDKHRSQWESTLKTYCSPVFGNLAVKDVDTAFVLRALEPIWTKKNETATRVRSRIENVLSWATVRGYRTGDNPARWVGHLKQLLPNLEKSKRVKHHAALTFLEIGQFFMELRAVEGVAARALEFTILTAARTNEVIAAKPEEFNFNDLVWTIPPERMKAHREHRVPLSPRAVAIVREMMAIRGPYVFDGIREDSHLSNMAMLSLLRRMGKTFTVHGFRSSFRDWAAECTSYPRDVCEMALAHVISDKTEAAYRRGDLFDKRRRLMNDWEKYCGTTNRKGSVIPLKASKR